ncbi:Flp pilus assembly complex ATPase component TadA [Agrobacterium rubi]|nr:Flp pilus assembly complex ATPase component TadA [Agrobacterium rubi]NTF24280.1 Flp pilus assembly complex ATPase component TadA [Agrobacterium rubi]
MSVEDSNPKILPFSDLYIRLDHDTPARFRPDITTPFGARLGAGNFRVPGEFNWYADAVKKVINDEGRRRHGIIEYLGRRLRYVTIAADGGEVWSAIRSLPLDLPDVDALNLNDQVLAKIKSWGRRKGFVLVSGTTGAGKTTTTVGLINYFMESIGGLVYTIEDPPELSMMGVMGKGFAIQTPVDINTSWADALEIAMRSNPNILMFGEIRSPESAGSLLLASGQLVMTTIHASSAADTITAVMQKAETSLGESAKGKLADGLIGVIHQTMTERGPRVELLEPTNDPADPIRASIRAGKYSQIKGSVPYEPTGKR